MAEYALLISGAFARSVSAETQPPNIPHKNVVWLPFIREATPSFDPKTQVLLGPTIIISVDNVTAGYSVRQKTQQELDANKQAYIDNVDMLFFEVLFNHENRIRVLDGQNQVTKQQFKTALLGLL